MERKYWIVIGVVGLVAFLVLFLFCGLCGVLGYIGFSGERRVATLRPRRVSPTAISIPTYTLASTDTLKLLPLGSSRLIEPKELMLTLTLSYITRDDM